MEVIIHEDAVMGFKAIVGDIGIPPVVPNPPWDF
jgi:hypothetical protein